MPVHGSFAAPVCNHQGAQGGGVQGRTWLWRGWTQPRGLAGMGAAPIGEDQHLCKHLASPRQRVAGRALAGRAPRLPRRLIKQLPILGRGGDGHREPVFTVSVQLRSARCGTAATTPSRAMPFAFHPHPLPQHICLIKAAYLEALNSQACKRGGKRSVWRPISRTIPV